MTHLKFSLQEFDIFYYAVVGLIAVAILVLFIVEIIAKLNDVPNDNVNIVIRNWAYGRFYFITFFCGVLAGHLFLGASIRWLDCSKVGIPFECSIFDVLVVAAFSLLLLVTGLIFQKKRTSKTFQVILFSIGLFIGHFVWSMNNFD